MSSDTNRKVQVNSAKGTIWYGMHFYPGVAEYQEPGQDPYRVFLNEATIREMDPTFAGRPVFVTHVDEVTDNQDELRGEADGYVVESFYNAQDGKHWVKFIAVSEKAERAIKNGWRLSNCYVPKSFAQGGVYSGVSYAKEITGGEYEHLAIVPNPRYEESVILSPEQYKKYCEEKEVELKKLSNERKEKGMLKFFKKTKVENAVDIENMSVVLPKTGKEVSLTKLINDADMHEEKKDMNAGMADPSHKVKIHDGSYMNVAELVEAHKKMHDELEAMKGKKEDDAMETEHDLAEKEEKVEVHGDDKAKDNDDMDDEEAKKKALALAEHEEKEIEVAKKKNEAKAKADKLRNAHLTVVEPVHVELSSDKVARGRVRYGS